VQKHDAWQGADVIKYQLTRGEIIRRLWSMSMRKRRIILSMVWLVLVGVIFLIVFGQPAGYVGIPIIALGVLAPLNMWTALAKSIGTDSVFIDPVILEYDEARLRLTRPTSNSEWNWSRLRSVAEDDEYFFLYTSKGGTGLATMVPKVAFSSAEEMKRFWQFANEGITKAQ
jgi:hypothetical protein